MFHQVGPIDHFTYVSGPVAQPSAENEYIAACTEVMAPEQSRIIYNEFMNKDPDVVT